MTEQQLQNKIIKRYENEGFFVMKLINTNKNGIPDLIVIKNGECFFVEVKKPDGKLSKLQEYRIEELKKFGTETRVERE